jgi:phosphoribosylglycinamide formyltransferase-1
MKKLAIFASGAGSNAQKIIDRFRNHAIIKVSLIACNRPDAGVIGIAERKGVPVLMIERDRFTKGDAYIGELEQAGIDVIVLAGFLWKIPARLVESFRGRILNIHPALLPAHGGKGMYGKHVHEAVIASGDLKSGITEIPVMPGETPDTLAVRIHELEHRYFPSVIEKFVLGADSPIDLSTIESMPS